MVIINTVSGDLLDAKEPICQQCNCLTIKPHGLSKYISDKYSWADPYTTRPIKTANTTSSPDEPGTIVEFKNPLYPYNIVLCFMAQWCPGKPYAYNKFYSSTPCGSEDNYSNRKKWFQECLDILDENNYDTVAMPYGIGCGLAGGKWVEYKQMIEECKTKIVIYKLDTCS